VPKTEIVTTTERTDLHDQLPEALDVVWPEFIRHDPISNEYMDRVRARFGEYDLLLVDNGQVVAGGWGVPIAWDGTVEGLPGGYDDGLVRAMPDNDAAAAPDTLSLMAIAVRPDRRGQGLASEVIAELRDRATSSGLVHVLAPVRPTTKARYPLTPMDHFMTWFRDDGLHLDPWIRAHQRMGAEILAPALRSMVVVGTVSEWERWASMAFPESGRYVVPEALSVVEIDREADRGTYVEPNLWMQHA
jgi:GNAT superfamily N-acetyltransferase